MNNNKSNPRGRGIAWRLGGGFAALLALLLLCSATALWQMHRLGSSMTAILDGDVIARRQALQVESLMQGIGVNLRQAILSDSADAAQRQLTAALALRAELLQARKALDAAAAGEAQQRAAQAVAAAVPAFLNALDNTAAALKNGNPDEARKTLTRPENVQARATLLSAVHEMFAAADAGVTRARAGANRVQTEALVVLGVLAAVAAAAAVGIGWVLTAGVVVPVRQAIAAARRIAGGNLTEDVHHQRRDELGELLDEMQAMQAALRGIVSGVRLSAESIQTASAEVSSGNADLAVRTEQAASSLQETASSMEELSSTVAQTAQSAQQANELAESAAGVARRGGEVVSQVVATMGQIDASSKRIADIVGVIDGIAFQTNILALNAAVEAARAGEQGRGFAVVASEVRSLAHRSAESAREIKSLIAGSVGRVEQGTALVAEAGRTMDDIVASVRRVTDIISEITAAANEQTSGIGQVTTAVGQLDRMTQQNAALVEQATAAAQSMTAQADRLVEAVHVFAVNEAQTATAVA
ncbi:MAG: methyl-accepting chemotaxis protein [Rubrivivax sp.]